MAGGEGGAGPGMVAEDTELLEERARVRDRWGENREIARGEIGCTRGC